MAENRELALVLKLVADQFKSELKNSQGALGSFNDFIKDWKTQLTAAATALFAIAKSTANYGDELVKMGQRMGTSIADTARLQHAARLADTDLQGLSTTLGFLSKNMLAAAQGNEEARRTFHTLGLSVTTAQGQLKGTTEILLELNDTFRLMPEGPEKTALAMLALGKSGKEVLPLLNSDLREAFKEAERFGLVMNDKAARAAEHFNDELTKLQGAIRGVTNDVGTLLIPKFDALAHALTTIVEDAHAAINALTGLDKLEAAQIGIVQPEGGGRRRRVMPTPSAEAMKGFATEPFFKTEQQAAADATEAGAIQKGLGEWALTVEQMRQRAKAAANAEAGAIQEGLGTWIVKVEQMRQQAVAAAKAASDAEEGAIQEGLGTWIVKVEQMRQQAVASAKAAADAEEAAIQKGLGEWIVKTEQMRQEAAKTFFDGWAEGMRKYVGDTQSGFGLAADMARRTAQAMEQGFRTFFFDLMDGKIKSLKDVFVGMLGFVKQIIAQITAQLVATQVLKLALGGLGSLGGGAGGNFGVSGYDPRSGFATGGSFTVGGVGGTDSQRVGFMATPGERVTVETPDQQRRGGGATINITVNAGGGSRDSSAGAAPNWTQLARDLGRLVEAKLIEEQRPGGLLAGGAA